MYGNSYGGWTQHVDVGGTLTSARVALLERVQAHRDRQLKAELLADKGVQLAQQKLEEQTNGYGLWGRRRLLAGALRVRRGMVPKLVAAFDRCQQTLGFAQKVELYVKPDPMLGAFLMKSPTGPLSLAVTSTTIERFSDAELVHVVGHELAHALYDHTSLPMPLTAMVEDMAGPIVSRAKALELYLWCRSAEISADRVGLLCARDLHAATRAFLKLQSGLPDALLGDVDTLASVGVDAMTSQVDSIASAPVARKKPREDDDSVEAYSTHPYTPLRLRALAMFARSDAYYQAIGAPVPADATPIAEVERAIESALEVMEASYLEEKGDDADVMRRVLFCAGHLVCDAAGKLDDLEKKAMVSLLGTDVFWPEPTADGLRKELDEKLPRARAIHRVWRTQLVQHLTVLVAADGTIDDDELRTLDDLCTRLDVPRAVVDQALKHSASPI